jgi:hypothetical protein
MFFKNVQKETDNGMGKIKSGNKPIQAFPVEITVKNSKMKITKAPKGWAARFPRLQR